jgi:K(+)-stimulated pyrophosphate-energized sodium pump
VTKFALILAIHVGGLIFAVLLARWLLGRDGGGAELRRVAGAVQRASDAFLGRELRLVAAATGVLAIASFTVHALIGRAGALGRIEAAFWATLGLVSGALGACLVARMAVRLAQGASPRALTAARASLDRSLSVSVRAAGSAALMVETLAATSLLLVFGLLFVMKGGASAGEGDAASLLVSIVLLLPGHAFGAAAAAMILQRAGSTYHAAADAGADLAGEGDAGLDHDDPRNPAVVADLVGDHVGPTAGRVVDLFVAASAANVAAVALGLAIYGSNGKTPAALGLALLPIVVRAFGVIACGFGVMVVRVEEQRSPVLALWRGHAATAVIALGGLAGATIWLASDSWQRLLGAGALGVVAAAAAAYVTRWRIDRRLGPMRELGESLKGGSAGAIAHGLGVGLESAAAPILVVGVAMASAFELGAGTGVAGGGLLGSFTALMTMLACAPYLLALGTFGAIADSARGVASVSSASLDDSAQRRAGRLDDAGFVATSVAQTYLITVGCLTALLAAATVPLLGGFDATAVSIDLTKPAVVWSGALGFAAVLAYAGNAARAANRGARGVAIEVERQLRGFSKQSGIPQVPRDFTPSYRACIEIVSRSALERVLPAVALALLLPIALAIAVRLAFGGADGSLVRESLSAFVAIAAVSGLAAALAIDATRSTLVAARRMARPRGTSGGFTAALSGDAVADIMGNSAAPAAHLLVKAVAASTLALAPFIT